MQSGKKQVITKNSSPKIFFKSDCFPDHYVYAITTDIDDNKKKTKIKNQQKDFSSLYNVYKQKHSSVEPTTVVTIKHYLFVSKQQFDVLTETRKTITPKSVPYEINELPENIFNKMISECEGKNSFNDIYKPSATITKMTVEAPVSNVINSTDVNREEVNPLFMLAKTASEERAPENVKQAMNFFSIPEPNLQQAVFDPAKMVIDPIGTPSTTISPETKKKKKRINKLEKHVFYQTDVFPDHFLYWGGDDPEQARISVHSRHKDFNKYQAQYNEKNGTKEVVGGTRFGHFFLIRRIKFNQLNHYMETLKKDYFTVSNNLSSVQKKQLVKDFEEKVRKSNHDKIWKELQEIAESKIYKDLKEECAAEISTSKQTTSTNNAMESEKPINDEQPAESTEMSIETSKLSNSIDPCLLKTIETLNNGMNELKTMFNDLKNQVTGLSTQVENIKKEIEIIQQKTSDEEDKHRELKPSINQPLISDFFKPKRPLNGGDEEPATKYVKKQ